MWQPYQPYQPGRDWNQTFIQGKKKKNKEKEAKQLKVPEKGDGKAKDYCFSCSSFSMLLVFFKLCSRIFI